jgi:hypothetical protein
MEDQKALQLYNECYREFIKNLNMWINSLPDKEEQKLRIYGKELKAKELWDKYGIELFCAWLDDRFEETITEMMK